MNVIKNFDDNYVLLTQNNSGIGHHNIARKYGGKYRR